MFVFLDYTCCDLVVKLKECEKNEDFIVIFEFLLVIFFLLILEGV